MRSSERTWLITYYWPPASGPGVHRWLRFARLWPRHLPPLTVVAPEGAAYPQKDRELERQVPPELSVVRVPILEPGQFLNINPGTAFVSGTQSWKTWFSAWLRGNLFIPDPRVFWVRPLVHYLRDEIHRYQQPVVITTGPPHSVHLAGLRLKRKIPRLIWIADFRDPWLEIDYMAHLRLTPVARWCHQNLEKKVVRNADLITVISPSMRELMEKKTTKPVEVIPNGMDPRLLPTPDLNYYPNEFQIVHTGSMPLERDAPELWTALASLSLPIKVRLIGQVDPRIIQGFQSRGLGQRVEVAPPVAHAQSLKEQQQAALLLVVANRTAHSGTILTGKIFEYLASGRPILAIGPEGGDLHQLITKSGAGWFIPYGQEELMCKAVTDAYQLWQKGQLVTQERPLHLYGSDHPLEILSRRLSLLLETRANQGSKA
ncbi:MAG: glycosyltransferase [Flavobacteriales bacterium]|nr:glycosyltransferase [Flavobacteriales bacterium]MDW8433031.1 glycosyltransferase [Flavobacteriales bacterium]